ncbi:MAG TPA: hypothetical protein DCP31_28945 [Cyanobacteria bacterium UBA8543]|nr:hypothetical protein [Cyanobacteria bacterium UBA8543]
MKLQYRGLPYESTVQVLKTVESGILAKYRGITYAVCCPIHAHTPQVSANLKYRGVLYTPSQASASKPLIQPIGNILNRVFS